MIKSKKYLKLCDCKNAFKSKQVCLALDENSSMDERIVIGGIDVECCPNCLAKQTWINFGRKLLIYIAIISAILIGFWALGKIIPLAWAGGMLVLIVFIAYMFINLYGLVRDVEINGAAYLLKRFYNRQGYIEPSDFIWMTEVGKSIISDPDYNFDQMYFLSSLALKNTEDLKLQNALHEIYDRTSSYIINEPLYIKKAFCKPIVIGLLITVSIFLVCLFMYIAFEIHSLTILLIGIAMMITLIASFVLLFAKKSYFGYIPILFCLIYIWAAGAMVWKDQLVNHYTEPLLLTLLLLIPALCYIPYLNKEE